jgi:hypothetical protein
MINFDDVFFYHVECHLLVLGKPCFEVANPIRWFPQMLEAGILQGF